MMMRRFSVLAVLAGLLALAGCGGGDHHGHRYGGPVRAVVEGVLPGHPCAPQNYYLQCGLRGQVRHEGLKPGLHVLANGVDFAWGGPSCARLRANGWTFGASYLSYDASKNWSRAQFNDYVTNGCKVVFVWEAGANDATAGYGLGRSQAQIALAQYRGFIRVGRVVIYFAIDCDCSGASVDGYFRGVLSVLPVTEVGAYGGIYPLNYLFSAHLITWGWQSYAWSGGLWNGSQLEQWLNGQSVDYDRAIAVDYGQYPPPTPPPPPGPTRAQIAAWSHAELLSLKAYRAHRCSKPVMGPGSCGQWAWRVVHFQVLVDQVQRRPHCFGTRRVPGAAVCEIVRPEAYIWGQAAAASQRAYRRAGCTSAKRGSCGVLRQRGDYFGGRSQRVVSTWG